jgi:Tfp pilus assembly protein PilE
MTTRSGTTLLEIVIALLILAGPLLAVIQSINANVRAARLNADHLTLEYLTCDLVEQLCAEGPGRLSEMDPGQQQQILNQLVKRRQALLPDLGVTDQYSSEAEAMIRSMRVSVTAPGGAELSQLFQIEVIAHSILSGSVKAIRMVQIPPQVPKSD